MPRSTDMTEAINLLKADHRTVEALFERFESTNGKSTKAKIATATADRVPRTMQ